jgi:hypothetical protein
MKNISIAVFISTLREFERVLAEASLPMECEAGKLFF